MDDMLREIFRRQEQLQMDKMGGSPRYFPRERKIQFIKDMTLALTDEVHEALNEVGWKPWAKSNHINHLAYHGELIDALHFLINLMIASDMTAEQVWRLYLEKNDVNRKRQEDGYTGLRKCYDCKRDLDDPTTRCRRDPEAGSWCQDNPGQVRL
jgi:dimeric dUTPase (all-alpha-NTP-PPase superfamily)